jgi:enoyl-CoA hydratase/carnithine racemase
MTEYQTLLIDVTHKVATIWLNRPERRNAFSPGMTRELNEAFARFEADDGVRAIVVTGAGSYFSAGADLSRRGGATFSGPAPQSQSQDQSQDQDQNQNQPHTERPAAPPEGHEPATEPQQQPPRVEPRRMRTPVIAALNGSAVGMGITLPVGWDVRFAAADAKYGFVFTRRGIGPEAGSSWLLPRLVGVSAAMELLLSGRIFSGTEGAAMGLFSRALPADEVLPAAQEFARDLAANTSAVSVAAVKALVYDGLDQSREESHVIEHQVFRWLGSQPDAREGVTAFLEKRAPDWPLSKTMHRPPML